MDRTSKDKRFSENTCVECGEKQNKVED